MQINLKQDGVLNDTHLLDGEFLDLMRVSKNVLISTLSNSYLARLITKRDGSTHTREWHLSVRYCLVLPLEEYLSNIGHK